MKCKRDIPRKPDDEGVPITLNGQPATLGFMSTEYAAGVIANLQASVVALTAERDRLRGRLDEAVGFIGKARELLGDWLSDAWSQRLADTTSEFFGSTDIAFGCEHVGCKQPFGHKHVIGGPAEQKAQP